MEDPASVETGTAPAPGGPYEFSSEDTALFGALTRWMRFLALLLIILALLKASSILRGDVTAALVMILYTVTGAWTFRTARSFRRIVDSEGSDISHLMAALGGLNDVLTVAVVLVTILLALGTGGILVTLFIAVFT